MAPKNLQEFVRDGRGHPLPTTPDELLATVKEHGLLITQPGQSSHFVPPQQALLVLLDLLSKEVPSVQRSEQASRPALPSPPPRRRRGVVPPSSPSRFPPNPFPVPTAGERRRGERVAARQAKRNQRLYVLERAWLDYVEHVDNAVIRFRNFTSELCQMLLSEQANHLTMWTLGVCLGGFFLMFAISNQNWVGQWFWGIWGFEDARAISEFGRTLRGYAMIGFFPFVLGKYLRRRRDSPLAPRVAGSVLIVLFFGLALLSIVRGNDNTQQLWAFLCLSAAVTVAYWKDITDSIQGGVPHFPIADWWNLMIGTISSHGVLLATPVLIVLFDIAVSVSQSLCAILALLTMSIIGIALLAVGVLGFAGYLVGLVSFLTLLLIPLTLARLGQYAWLGYRRIFYSCPKGDCSYRGLPIHVCPHCETAYDDLWPSFYGVLHHRCGCGQRLPTFDISRRGLRRSQLPRLCGGCRTPLLGESIGTLPVRLVPIFGSPASGKTTFVLMTIRELLKENSTGQSTMRAALDIPAQRPLFDHEQALLSTGQVPAKTAGSIPDAFALRLHLPQQSCLLYLYDPPGEELQSTTRLAQHPYLEHLDGLILLVDPLCFATCREHVDSDPLSSSLTPLNDVVASLIGAVDTLQQLGGTQCSIPLAVVLTKADLPMVKMTLGDSTTTAIESAHCRTALMEWGAGNAVRALEQKFTTVHYFACSALGRTFIATDTRPFTSFGILSPWLWLLAKTRRLR